MSLVQEKVASDASRMLYDDVLFCHLMEEVLQFEKELRGNHAYPAVLPGLLHILLDDAVLQKWLVVEKKSELFSVLRCSCVVLALVLSFLHQLNIKFTTVVEPVSILTAVKLSRTANLKSSNFIFRYNLH